MSPRPPPWTPPAPSPATRMREPVSTPAGIFTSRLRRLFAQPPPWHCGHGLRLTRPDPPHAGQGSSSSNDSGRLTPVKASSRESSMATSTSPPRPAATHEVVEIDVLGLAEAGRSPRPAQISEDRAEEIREALAALLETHLAAPIGRAVEGPATACSGLRIALPVGSQRVVALPLLRVAQDLVGLGHLLEPGRRLLALGNVGVVLAGEPSVGGLDRLVVGVLGHAENLVVVLVFHGV